MAKKDVKPTEDMNQFVPSGLRWLYEMEAVNSTALLNNLYGNIYSFPHVVDAEILLDRFGKKMLIYVKFTWFVRNFWISRKKYITMSILDQLQELLPSFEFRIIEDKALFNLAVQRMREHLFGGKNETASKNNSDVDGSNSATASSTSSESSQPKESAEGPQESESVSQIDSTDKKESTDHEGE